MYRSTRSSAVNPPFGGLKRAKIHLLPYDLGERGGRILVRVLYWTEYSRKNGWKATLYDDAGKIVRESEYAPSEAEALQDALHRFVRLRDAPYLFLYDLFETLVGGENSTLRFTVYNNESVRLDVMQPLRKVRYGGSRRRDDCDELRGQKIPLLHRYESIGARQLIGLLSEYRLIDLFHREVWPVGERPDWFAGIRFGTKEDDAHGIDLWVSCRDHSPDIPIQVASSEGGRLKKLTDQLVRGYANSPPIIVAGEGFKAKYLSEQLVHSCEAYRLGRSNRRFLKTA